MDEVEAFSPMLFREVDCLCRGLSSNVTCDRCGKLTVDGCHAGIAFRGWYCASCCYACDGSFTLTMAEFQAMAVNRDAERRRAERDLTTRKEFRRLRRM